MALVQILTDALTGNQRGTRFSYKDIDSSTSGLQTVPDFSIDVTLTENHNFEAEPTENPVESGVNIADHIDLKPETITLSGVISDTPLNFGTSIQGAATAVGANVGKKIIGPLGNLAGVGAGSVASLATSSKNRMKNSFDHLRDLQIKRVPFTVITGLHRYTSMVITSLTMNRDSKSGRSFNFTATLKKIRIVTSQSTNIPNVTKSVVGAGKNQDLGKKSTSAVSPDNQTLTLKAVLGVKNLFTGGN